MAAATLSEAARLIHRCEGVRRYNGRGMRDRYCAGIVGADFGAVLAALLTVVRDADDSEVAADVLIERVEHGACTDSMGKDVVVYFPSIPPPPESVERAEEES